MVKQEKTLPCGCKTYTNLYGEVKIWEWNCKEHIERKEEIIQSWRDEGYHGMLKQNRSEK